MPQPNPLNLHKLQLKTLSLLQAIARQPELAEDTAEGGRVIPASSIPHAHGTRFQIAGSMVDARHARGLDKETIWKALEENGLAVSGWPDKITLTKAGQDYYTGVAREVFLSIDI